MGRRQALDAGMRALDEGKGTMDAEAAVVIEDDEDIRSLLQDILREAGFTVVGVGRGRDGVAVVAEHQPLVVTLDVELPDMDGFEVLRRIRAESDCYVLIISAHVEEMDVLTGLYQGADEYITKPFRPREVRARIGAMVSRHHRMMRAAAQRNRAVEADPLATGPFDTGLFETAPVETARIETTPYAAAPSSKVPSATDPSATDPSAMDPAADEPPVEVPAEVPAEGPTIEPTAEAPSSRAVSTDASAAPTTLLSHHGLLLDPHSRTVDVDDREVHLTRTEFDLLHAVLRAGGRVVEKSRLVRILRHESPDSAGFVSAADRNAIDFHLGNLRRKLGESTRSPRWIQTVRGVGYRLTPGSPRR